MEKAFRGGVPYAVDVRRLMETFPAPSLEEGREIRHEELEAVVNAPHGSSRYYSVVNAWIRQTKNSTGIFIVWVPGLGIKILPPAEILTFAEVKTRQKIRQTGRAIKIYPFVNRNRLDAIGQARLDHDMRILSTMADVMHATKKEMAINLAPIASLPRPRLIKEA